MPESNEDAQIMGAEMFRRLLEQSKNEVYTDKESKQSAGEAFLQEIARLKDERKTFNDYQDFVKTMKVYPEKHAIVYPALGICGEGGEIAEKVKKWLRGDRELDKLELLKEAGDVLWYLASLADDLGYSFQDMVDENVKKLSSRKARGVQKGDGDNR